MGFAIPINIVERVVPALIERGEYKHACLGVSGRTYSPAWADALGFPPEVRGAYIMSVRTDGPSRRAGLQGRRTGHQYSAGRGHGQRDLPPAGWRSDRRHRRPACKTFDDILVYLESYKSPGDEVQLRILRPGEGEADADRDPRRAPRLTE